MTGWAAIVPLKAPGARKSRLEGVLARPEREALSDAMAAHVLGVLARSPAVATVTLLAPAPLPDIGWWPDSGRGLNAELDLVRAGWIDRPLLVLHADLPELTAADIARMIAACDSAAVAIAPDRHDIGTNALAIPAGRAFAFHFGPGSFARHRAQAGDTVTVRSQGLAHDLDTPADLAAWTMIDERARIA